MTVKIAKTAAEDNSERKRISIPKADDSVLAWWATQNDPSLSVRLLIRNEIERSGYTDIAFRPVVQQPRRGRPPVAGGEASEGDQLAEDPRIESEPAAVAATANPSPTREPLHAVNKPQRVPEGGFSMVDDLMNG